jgi:hypothetical protein
MKLPEVYGATYGAIPTEKGSGLYGPDLLCPSGAKYGATYLR